MPDGVEEGLGVAGQLLAERTRAAGDLHVPAEPGARRVALPAARPAAGAGQAATLDDHVAELACRTLLSEQELAGAEHRATDPRPKRDQEGLVAPSCRAHPVLADERAVRIVADGHLPAAEPVLEQRRQVGPEGVRQVRSEDQSATPRHDAGDPDPDGRSALRVELGHEGGDGAADQRTGFGAGASWRGHPALVEGLALRRDGQRQDLRAAHVDADRRGRLLSAHRRPRAGTSWPIRAGRLPQAAPSCLRRRAARRAGRPGAGPPPPRAARCPRRC